MKIKLTKLWNLSRCYSTNGWRLYHVSVVNIRRKNCIESLKKIIQRNTSWYNVWLCRFGQITEASVHVKIFWRHFYGSVEVNAHVFTCTNHAILHTMNNMTFVNNGKTNIRKLFFLRTWTLHCYKSDETKENNARQINKSYKKQLISKQKGDATQRMEAFLFPN